MITTELLRAMSPRFTDPTGGQVAMKLNWAAEDFKINTPLRVIHWLAQLAHESEFIPQEERLNYSASRLVEVWPSRFTSRNAAYYAYNPVRLANRVYSNRMGNGDEASGDGWTYRGRGYIQLTGKDNYRIYGNAIGYDLLGNPDLCLQYGISSLVAGAYFKINNILPMADRNDILAVSRAVNGPAAQGFSDRLYRFNLGARFIGLKV